MIIREQKLYVLDIVEAIESIFKFIGKMTYEEFVKDEKTYSAVIWKFTIIGEAAKNINNKIVLDYSEIPWAEMARMRDRLIHGYGTIKPEIVWKSIKNDLPGLPDKLRKIASKL